MSNERLAHEWYKDNHQWVHDREFGTNANKYQRRGKVVNYHVPLICPECKGMEVFKDDKEIYCRTCGLVIEDTPYMVLGANQWVKRRRSG